MTPLSLYDSIVADAVTALEAALPGWHVEGWSYRPPEQAADVVALFVDNRAGRSWLRRAVVEAPDAIGTDTVRVGRMRALVGAVVESILTRALA